MSEIRLTLPDSLKSFVEAQAKKEGFGSAAEYVRAVIEQVRAQHPTQSNGTEANQPSVPLLDAEPATLERKLAEIAAKVPAEEWAKLPKDLAENLDHYLYGAPKP